MTNRFWPPSVTQDVEQGSWQETPERNVATFQTEVGPPKQRRRSSVASRLISFKVFVSSQQLDDLLQWYEYDLKDGVLPFMRQNARTLELETYTFVDAPSDNDEGAGWFTVTISLQRQP